MFADLFIIRDNSRVEDYMEVLLYYPGMRARIKSSYLVREPIPSYDINGHLGTFLKSRTDVQERHLLAGEMPGRSGLGRRAGGGARALAHGNRWEGCPGICPQ